MEPDSSYSHGAAARVNFKIEIFKNNRNASINYVPESARK